MMRRLPVALERHFVRAFQTETLPCLIRGCDCSSKVLDDGSILRTCSALDFGC